MPGANGEGSRFTRRQLLAYGAGGAALLGAAGYLSDEMLSGASSSEMPVDIPAAASQTLAADASAHWLFGGIYVPGSEAPAYDDSGFTPVNLPHTVVPLSWEGWKPTSWEHRFVYRRHLLIDADLGVGTSRRCFIDFAGAMTDAVVYMNGQEIGRHHGGYLPFGYECTDALHTGQNLLAVVVDGSFNLNVPPDRPLPYSASSVDFWQPAGLYRRSTIRLVPRTYISDVFAKPVDVLGSSRRVEVDVTVDLPKGSADTGSRLSLVVALEDGSRVLGTGSARLAVDGSGRFVVPPGGVPGMALARAEIAGPGLESVGLWSPESPRLYTVRAVLMDASSPLHELSVPIGFREAHFAEDGFYLNGERTKLFGVCRHQFFPFAGAAMPDRVQRHDAVVIRGTLNANMVRCSHYPQSEAFVDACDQLGLMVWEEAPGWDYLGDAEWLERSYDEIGSMILRDRNHPSIVLWGARLNETLNDASFYTRTQQLAASLDDSRQTTGAMTDFLYTNSDFQQDVFGYNDYTSSGGWPALRPPLPGKPYFVSECIGTLSGPFTHYRLVDPMWVQESQAIAHAMVLDQAFSDDRYCGITTWSGFDYPSGNGNQIDGVKYTGVVDLFRNAKPGAAIYMAQVDPSVRPVVEPAFYWDFGPGSPRNGPGKNATICTNCDRLVLYVGGRRVADLTPNRSSFAHIPYAPVQLDLTVDPTGLPELLIEGYVGGHHVISRRFSADPGGDRLDMAADDARLVADGSDGTRVSFRAVDRYGAPRPYVAGDLEITLSGPAVLVGSSPFPLGATGGAGAVWVRSLAAGSSLFGVSAGSVPTSGGQPATGGVVVSAQHPVLGKAAVQLEVVGPEGPYTARPSGPPDRRFVLP